MNREEIEALSYQELVEAINEEMGGPYYQDELDDLESFLSNSNLSYMYGELAECHYKCSCVAFVWKPPKFPDNPPEIMFADSTPHNALIRATLLAIWEERTKDDT